MITTQTGKQSVIWVSVSLLCLGFTVCVYISMFGYVPQYGKLVHNQEKKTVLVTGAAGFIGFHLALNLHKQGHIVIALDNFNDYYDVRLKIDRAYELHKLGIQVYAEDVCTVDFLEEIFQTKHITHVAHLAAQAGVRYSLKNPQAYIKANVECQLALLNVMKDYTHIKLVYASSSSVYGKEADVPFQLSARTDHPGNMYAATKKTDELLGLHYCQAYGISSVGLRFFTVYGPWGRPDMSVYTFADAIYNKKKLPMFYISKDKPLGRDFTYVDDVVAGVIASLDYLPARCGERFNLGFGNPVSVIDMISIMEEEIGMKADIEKLPMPPTEILQTWADISTSTALLGFQPTTNLTKGIKEFVTWFKPYQKKRKEEKRQNEPSQSELWFAGKYEEQFQRHKKYNKNKEEVEVQRLLNSFQHEKEKYLAEHQQEKKEFDVYRKIAWQGYDLVNYSRHDGDYDKLAQLCKDIPVCVAFTPNGMLKSHIPPRSLWKTSKTDVYVVKHGDWCQTDVHVCHVDATCTNDTKDLYNCKCKQNFWGDGYQCLPIHGKLGKEFLTKRYFPYYHSIFNVSHMKSGKEFVEKQIEDRTSDDFLYVPFSENKIEQLRSICAVEPICIGFTSDGRLKYRLPKQSESSTLPIDSTMNQIYVFDINYCVFNEETCPENSECKVVSPGDSRCVCLDGYIMINSECIKPLIAMSLVPSLKHCTSGVQDFYEMEKDCFATVKMDIQVEDRFMIDLRWGKDVKNLLRIGRGLQ